jgi:hypothetical protein
LEQTLHAQAHNNRYSVKLEGTGGVNQNKTLKIVLAFLALLIVLTICFSVIQTPLSLKVSDGTLVSVSPANLFWEKTYGESSDDRALSAVPSDEGYLVVGSSRSMVANTTVGWALKIDGSGNQIWNKTFLKGFGTELRYAVNLTDGYLLVGNQLLASGEVNGYVAKISSQGTILWQTLLGSNGVNKLFSGFATTDSFVVFGLTQPNGENQSAAWVSKLDNAGNVVWSQTYGQPNETALRSGVLAQDGAYVLAGYTDLPNANNYDFYLLKIQPEGTLVWNRTYGTVESEKAYSMTKASDGYVLVGEVESQTTATDAWVLKVDFNGNIVWARTVGGKAADSPAYVTQSKDGGYLVAGFTFSFGHGQRDLWFFKINDLGQVLFSCTQGDAGFQEVYSLIETKNSSYFMAGWTDPPGQPALIGKKMYDFFVTEITEPKTASRFLSMPLSYYAIIIVPILIAASILLIKQHSKTKNKKK